MINEGEIPSFTKEIQKLINSSEAEYKEHEDELLTALLSYGMLRNYPVSYALVSQSAKELLMGNFSKGEKLYLTASYISPDLPAVHYIYAKALKDTGITGTFKSFLPFFKFVVLKYSNTFSFYELRIIWIYNIILFTIFIISLTALALFIKNFSSLVHFFNEIMGFFLPEWGIKVLIFLFFIIPFFLKIPIGYLIPSYLTFLLIFERKGGWSARVLGFLLLILFGSLNFTGKKLSTYFAQERLQYLTYLYNYHSGQWTQELLTLELNEKESNEKLFLKGLTFIKMGEYEKAKLIFENLLKNGYYKEKCLNNLGIIEYALGNIQNSEKLFYERIKTSELIPEAHYNLSIIYFSQAKLEEAKEELEIAKRILPQTIEKISRFSSKENINLLFIPSEIHPSELINRFKENSDPEIYKELMKTFFGKYPEDKALSASIICGIIILIFQIPFIKRFLPNLCKRCERVYCSLCDDSPLENECGLCYTIYILKEKISPEERIKFEIETSKRYHRKRWMVIISNILLPGMGYIVGNKNIRGFILLSFWILLLEPLFFSNQLTRGLMPFSVEISLFEIASVGLVAFIVWILTVFRMRSWR